MHIQVRRVEYRDVEAMRELYRQESNCQIIHDSALSRGALFEETLTIMHRNTVRPENQRMGQ